MKGARAIAIVSTLSMLAACAAAPLPYQTDADQPSDPKARTSYAKAVGTAVTPSDDRAIGQNVVPAAHRTAPRRHHRDHHHHHEPSPETQRAVEAALILTGSVFLCSFVVVVLDGSCEFGVDFGYHYY